MIKQQRFRINGMTCQHCVQAIDARLRQLPGAESVDVRIAPAQAVVCGEVDATAIVQAIADAGYLAVADATGVSVV